MERDFTAPPGNTRLDRFLAQNLEGYARTYLQALIRRGGATVDGKIRPPAYRLKGGERIRVSLAASNWTEMPFEDWVLYEDKDLLVLSKPAGLIMHPMGESWLVRPSAALGDAEANLAGLLIKHRPKVASSGVERAGIVHRLDRQTSGVLLVAKRPESQRALLTAFRERLVKKVYRAVVLGRLVETKVDAPIGRRSNRRRVEVSRWGRPARTDFKSLHSAGGMSVVEARPITGRTHQIRAHLALLKHPVAGDWEWFLDPEHKRLKELGHPRPPRMLLHAYCIRLKHPRTGKAVQYTAPLPKDFKTYWKTVSS
ncbi:MAG: RluA family pseudouridine synthase [Elusimicrobiota bacterium]